jgi:hypothetical protein
MKELREMAEETGFEPAPSPRLASVRGPQPENGLPCPDGVLISDARHALEQLHAGDVPPASVRLDITARAHVARLAELAKTDPVLRAVARVEAGGVHALTAFVDLLDLVIPDADPVPARKGGAA